MDSSFSREITPAPSEPVTLRLIAQHVGCSVATVSMALKNHPRISEAVRTEVQQVAARLGYRPNPRLGELMATLRAYKSVRFQSTVCALLDVPEAEASPYVLGLLEGVRARAKQHGYAVTVERVTPDQPRAEALHRRLQNCGVRGVLLLPPEEDLDDCSDWLDWNQYTVVSLSSAIHKPVFDTVRPNWPNSVREAIHQLADQGAKRVGSVLIGRLDQVFRGLLSASVTSVCEHKGIGHTKPFRLPPLPENSKSPMLWHRDLQLSGPIPGFLEWFVAERPDALLVACESLARNVVADLSLLGPVTVKIAVVDKPAGSSFPGVIERLHDIGATGMSLLDLKLKSNSTGEAAYARSVVIDGYWEEAAPLATFSNA